MSKSIFQLVFAGLFFWISFFPTPVLAQQRTSVRQPEKSFLDRVADTAAEARDNLTSSARNCYATVKQKYDDAVRVLGPLAEGAYSCAKEFMKGFIFDNLEMAGQAIDKGKECYSNPRLCAQQAQNIAKKAGSYVQDTGASAIKLSQFCSSNPSSCATGAIDKARNAASFVTQFAKNLKENFPQLPMQSIIDLICNVLGGVGAGVLLAIVTGGAGVMAVLGPMKNLMSVLKKFAKLPGGLKGAFKALNVPIEYLSKASSQQVDRITALLQKDARKYSPELRKALMSCQK